MDREKIQKYDDQVLTFCLGLDGSMKPYLLAHVGCVVVGGVVVRVVVYNMS